MCLLPRAHAQEVKQSVCPSVVVVVVVVVGVGTKIARFRDLGICACCKHNESVDICEKLLSVHFELLNRAHKHYKSCIFRRQHPLICRAVCFLPMRTSTTQISR